MDRNLLRLLLIYLEKQLEEWIRRPLSEVNLPWIDTAGSEREKSLEIS